MQDDWDLLLFTFIAIIPKGLRGALYCGTEHQNRYSEGYTQRDKHLPLYWFMTILLFAILLGKIIWSAQLLTP